MVLSAIFLISVVFLAGAKGWTYINMPIIQIPAMMGLIWFVGSYMKGLFESVGAD